MTLKGETVTKVNEEYKKNVHNRECLGLNVGNDDYWSDMVFDRTWAVCKIDEITSMIRELTVLKETIESITGVVL